MTRALLFTVVAGSIVSILSYAGSQALNPSVYDVLECVADAGGVDRCSAGGPEQPISSGEQPGSLAQVVDRYFAPLVETNNFYGAVFAARGDEVLVHKGYGWASIELAVPNSAESVFHIASVSKPITAAAVMLLSERGLVDLNAPLSRILSDYPNGDRLSLHNLLLHTSGIPDINVQPVYADLSHSHRTPAELVDAFKNLPLMFEPGARFQYSNSNYNLLALVIERVSGMSYGEFLEKEIFGPLEMDHTAHPERDATIVPHLVEGYAPIGRSELERAPWINWTVKTGNGSLYSTGEDLAKWVRGFFGGQILSPATLELATTPRLQNIGIDQARGDLSYVWSIGQYLDRRKVWFAGRSPGYSAAISYFPDENLTIVVQSNTYSLVTTQAADAIASMAFSAPYAAPQIRDAPLAPDVAKRWVGVYQFSERAPVPNMKMSVVEHDGRLTLEPDFAAMAPSALLPVADATFILRSYWMELKFDAEPGAAAKALTLFGARAERIE
jgi:CubicO group peptidase (beta-lactamase class C family)